MMARGPVASFVALVVPSLVAASGACSVSLLDAAGRACDDAHSCRDGRICSAGQCVALDASSPPDAGGTDGASAVTCTRVASPGGSDANPGTLEQPFATVGRLVAALGPGIVGCLRAGTYAGNVDIGKGGSAGALATLRSYPGERAQLAGRILISAPATFFALSNVDVDGTNSLGDSGAIVLASDVLLEDDDFTTTSMSGCVRLGDLQGADASRAVVRRNRIHRCGLSSTDTAFGVMVVNGGNIRLEDNVIYDNPDHGILFYPAAHDSLATHNVLDGNGANVIFGGTTSATAHDNVVERNVVTFPATGRNVGSFYDPGATIGKGNVVRRNCLFGGGAKGGVPDAPQGFSVSPDNVVADPAYVDRAARDFRLGPSSACLAVVDGS